MAIDYDITTRVAAVQSEPVWFDGDATVDKACRIIDEAGQNGAKVIGFPELYVSGYPWWLWVGSPLWSKQFHRRYYASSMELGDRRMDRIREAARRNGMFVVMGYSESAGASLYISQVFIGDTGEILANRRKLKPTDVERTLFGEGDGSDLFVVDTPAGRIGGLSCWEHYQALEIFTMTALHEQIHVASWPSNDVFQHPEPCYSQTTEADRKLTSVYAALTQSFVICSTTLIGPSGHEAWQLDAGQKAALPIGGGWAGIFGPDGDELTRDRRIAPEEEGILYADIDLNDIVGVKAGLDPVGHYSRPDIFSLTVNTQGNSLVRYAGAADDGRQVGVVRLDGNADQGEQVSSQT
ncbi:carbon-nitrogen hydrolase family protein [Amycolatopsis jejuensis]|uniref:carbon-nitrogen hydrolase family protein n=1 Tax=Amycolatopsis jejuensis TaxID=330084 RepID=UPI000527BCB3|nr:carbon-nitrogen hydrolase family protein [Amycolatopsis jejuensis]